MNNATMFSIGNLLLISALLISGVHSWSSSRHHQGSSNAKCERLNVSFCRGLRYNLTAMPNIMGHEDQLQAERGVKKKKKNFSIYLSFLSFSRRFVTSLSLGLLCIVMLSPRAQLTWNLLSRRRRPAFGLHFTRSYILMWFGEKLHFSAGSFWKIDWLSNVHSILEEKHSR